MALPFDKVQSSTYVPINLIFICRYIMKDAYVGDWFVLHQLSKNVNTYFFREFVKELRMEMKERPKHSRGRKKDGTLSRKNSKLVKTNMNHIPSQPGTLEQKLIPKGSKAGDQETLKRDAHTFLNMDDSDGNM